MSAIKKALVAATGIEAKRGEDDEDFKVRLIKAVADLDDKSWDKLSTEAQDWFNDAADAYKSKKALPPFGDEKEEKKEEKKEEPYTRRRRSSDDDDEKTAKKEEKPAKPKVGDLVSFKTKRGKEVKGVEVIEITDEFIAVKEDGEEVEYDLEKITNLTVDEKEERKEESSSRRRRSSGDDDDEKRAKKEDKNPIQECKKGDQVVIVTKRDRTVKGKVVEVTEEFVAVDTGDEEVEIDISKMASLTIDGGKEESSSRRRRSSEDADEKSSKKEEKDEPRKRTSSEENGGVSVTTRMRELIAEDPDAKMEDVAKLLKKEGLTYRDNTLKLVYADCHKFLGILRDKKRLK